MPSFTAQFRGFFDDRIRLLLLYLQITGIIFNCRTNKFNTYWIQWKTNCKKKALVVQGVWELFGVCSSARKHSNWYAGMLVFSLTVKLFSRGEIKKNNNTCWLVILLRESQSFYEWMSNVLRWCTKTSWMPQFARNWNFPHFPLAAPGSWQEGKQRVSSVTKVSGHVAFWMFSLTVTEYPL